MCSTDATTTNKEAEIKQILDDIGVTNQITCSQAHELIEGHDITFDELGVYCDKNGVKIRNCKLGCF
jgi:hypothetical protein